MSYLIVYLAAGFGFSVSAHLSGLGKGGNNVPFYARVSLFIVALIIWVPLALIKYFKNRKEAS